MCVGGGRVWGGVNPFLSAKSDSKITMTKKESNKIDQIIIIGKARC